ncbi:hypothetical protein BC830DRAFT_658405 [Chytriomyces sp. MP71]|nr:hypothetical protein BC830DRAFT_658405 [Chytriomyces sp. MP71]
MHNEGKQQPKLLDGINDTLHNNVTMHNASKDVHEDGTNGGSEEMIVNALATCSALAPPPTSKKLAGSTPLSLIMFIVAMAILTMFTLDQGWVIVRGYALKRLAETPTQSSNSKGSTWQQLPHAHLPESSCRVCAHPHDGTQHYCQKPNLASMQMAANANQMQDNLMQ